MFLILGPFVEIGLVIVSEKVSIATSGWSDNSYTFTLLSQRAPGCRIHRFWDLLVHTNSSLRGPTFPLVLSGHEIRGLQQRSVGRELAEGYVVVSSWPPLHPHLLLWLLPAQLQGLWGQGFWQRSVARVPFLCVCVCVRVCACVCVCVCVYVFVSEAYWPMRARRSRLRMLRGWSSEQRWRRRHRGLGAA